MQPDFAEAYARAAEQLTGPDPDARPAALRELAALAEADPELRLDVVAAVCGFLCDPAGADTGPAAELLAALARRHPAGDCAPGCADCLDVDLTGAVLTADTDFGGCRFGTAAFADAHFRGACSFAGARFSGEALFQRAVFERGARFTDVRFGAAAVFGRTRFRADADFSGARFEGLAWFGRGEETLSEDEEVWEQAETWRPVAWDEPGEHDPCWPLAVLDMDYQEWAEGGDGARFGGRASFAGARFADAAWFWKARFGGAADFGRAVFGGRVHLVQPAVDLTGARHTGRAAGAVQAAGTAEAATAATEEREWPLGWTAAPPPTGAGLLLAEDPAVAPYARQLAHPDAEVRRTSLRLLGELGDARPDMRQRAADTVCAYLRSPLPSEPGARQAESAVRDAAQRLLADRTRPAAGDRFWSGLRLHLSGATLTDFDLSGCRLAYGDFTGTLFQGATSFAGAAFGTRPYDPGADFCLPGSTRGRAAFRGRADFTAAALARAWGLQRCLTGCVVTGIEVPEEGAIP
ncbi:pentapeptide repeat-containing protein [Actinacidiphila sp. bgisy145]|uniref:pentapeptide repeat-containing protein n=1 Tax=Actinacidiphila sp. bgisy145 TaxID=3413792 RepID=UPI003EBB7CAE